MDSSNPALKIIYSRTALEEFGEIWDWNAAHYSSAQHATEYIDFLKTEIEKLSTELVRGRLVETNPSLRYLLIKRNSSGHGHVAVFRISKTAIRILHVFHTSQDWQSKVKAK